PLVLTKVQRASSSSSSNRNNSSHHRTTMDRTRCCPIHQRHTPQLSQLKCCGRSACKRTIWPTHHLVRFPSTRAPWSHCSPTRFNSQSTTLRPRVQMRSTRRLVRYTCPVLVLPVIPVMSTLPTSYRTV